jgi:hypothetical protein
MPGQLLLLSQAKRYEVFHGQNDRMKMVIPVMFFRLLLLDTSKSKIPRSPQRIFYTSS